MTLQPGATVTLHTGSGTNTSTDLYWHSLAPIWDNESDTAFLYDVDGRFVAGVSWGF
ncbi:MAG: lamin tail domain-containing protein [Anaerolineae bacterium]